jgi:hypothetical protein
MKLIIKPSTAKNKRLTAIFYNDEGKKLKTVNFGLKGGSTYIDHKDKKLRSRYISRHRPNENWNDPMTAGALAKDLLWGPYTDLDKNISSFKRKFKLK